MSSKEGFTKGDVVSVILGLLTVFIFFIGIAIALYVGLIVGGINPANLGTFGDLFGGVLNPFLALFSVVLLSYTLIQNNDALRLSAKEIELTREEMEKARVEYAKSSTAQEGMLKLERENIDKQEAIIKLEGSRVELEYRMELLSKRLNSANYEVENYRDRASLDRILTLQHACILVGVSQRSIFELKETIREACVIGRILQQYINSGEERKLGRELYLRAGDSFFTVARALSKTSFLIEYLDCSTIRVGASSHELLANEHAELSEYADRFNKKMLLTH